MAEKLRDCGACSACCFLLSIPTLAKPACLWCGHAERPHGGCGIYENRPDECVAYSCIWLASQSRAPEERMTPDTRPDRSKVMFHDAYAYSPDEEKKNTVYVHVFPDHPRAWMEEPILDHINMMRGRGVQVQVMIGDRTVVLETDGGEKHLLEGPAERTAFREIPEC